MPSHALRDHDADAVVALMLINFAGTVYVVSVSGPKMYEIGPGRDWPTRTGQNLQLYQVIAVNGGSLRFEARTVTGQLFDAFEIIKDRNGVRRFVDRKPDKPATQ